MKRHFAFISLAVPLLLLMVADSGAVSAAAGSGRVASSGKHSSLPAFVQGTVLAISLQEPPPPSVPGLQPVGVLVPKANIVATAASTNRVVFGIAVYQDLRDATYPVISRDGGAVWSIDGPPFYVAAAQAASVTSSVGAVGPHGAYFWGRPGSFVKITTDEGDHWWIADFPDGVYRVSGTRRTLRAVALGNEVRGGAFQAYLYVSNDSGKTWHFHGQLRNVKL